MEDLGEYIVVLVYEWFKILEELIIDVKIEYGLCYVIVKMLVCEFKWEFFGIF